MSRPSRIQKTLPVWTPKPQPWLRDRDHLKWIASFVCVFCGRTGCSVAAHIRAGGDGAMGRKPSDGKTLPLCGFPKMSIGIIGCHERQHQIGEPAFWADFMARGGPDPVGIADALWRVSGDTDAGERVIFRARQMLTPIRA